MRALQVRRSAAKFGMARIASAVAPLTAARIGPLEYRNVDPPTVPDEGWVRLRPRLSGICGSDLALLEGKASAYFDPIVSFPFTPGHEVVADVLDGELAGRRAIVIPLLHCAVRGIDPVCDECSDGATHRCERTAFGHIAAGLQCGELGAQCCDVIRHERLLGRCCGLPVPARSTRSAPQVQHLWRTYRRVSPAAPDGSAR